MSTLGLPFLRKRPRPKPPGLSAADDDPEEEEQRYRKIDLKLLRRTMGLLAPYKKRYALGLLFGLTMAVLDMFSPKFTQWIMDYCLSFTQHKLATQPTLWAAGMHICGLVAKWAAVLISRWCCSGLPSSL